MLCHIKTYVLQNNNIMKVLSLIQPIATLVVTRHKLIETRSWNTKHRGPLLIHASLGKKYGGFSARELCYQKHFKVVIPPAAYDKLPFGEIIGCVFLEDVISTDRIILGNENNPVKKGPMEWDITDKELAFGDYSDGRYAWLLRDAVEFKKQLPIKGSLMLWDLKQRMCIKCGCTDNHACISKAFGPCWWDTDDQDICSHCIEGVTDIIPTNQLFNNTVENR